MLRPVKGRATAAATVANDDDDGLRPRLLHLDEVMRSVVVDQFADAE
jgi:hypothetical protein